MEKKPVTNPWLTAKVSRGKKKPACVGLVLVNHDHLHYRPVVSTANSAFESKPLPATTSH